MYENSTSKRTRKRLIKKKASVVDLAEEVEQHDNFNVEFNENLI